MTRAAVGVVVLGMLAAGCARTADGKLEGERMRLSPGAQVVPAFASAGRAVIMRANGTVRGTLPTFGANLLEVDAASTDCFGGAHMVVTVDRRVVINTVVSARPWKAYYGAVSLSAGVHAVAITFDNDLYRSVFCDRNLLIDVMRTYAIRRSPPPPPRPPSPPPPPTGGHPHVMVIVEENREVTGVSGYTNLLGLQYGNASRWTGVAHPSLPNYLALISGSTQGVTDDGTGYVFNGDNLGHQLSAAGVSWKAYMEGMPSPCYAGAGSGGYAKRHNPFAYFSNITRNPSICANVVPFSQFDVNRLPDFVWITPNLCNDGHDCGNASVDVWLQAHLPAIQRSAWYRNNGLIILTWDEGDSGAGGGGNVKTVVLHGAGCRCTLSTPGNHYGTLHTIEQIYGLRPLGAAAFGTSLLPLVR